VVRPIPRQEKSFPGTDLDKILVKGMKIPAGDIELNAKLLLPRGLIDESGTPRERLPVVIFHHGYGGNIDKGNILPYAAAIALGLPCAALLYDCRGHGKSPGTRFQYARTINDVQRVVAFAVQLPGVDLTRIGFLGFSLGGAIGLLSAYPDERFKAVVGVSCIDVMPLDFTTAPSTAGMRLARWFMRVTGFLRQMADEGPDPPPIQGFPPGTDDAVLVRRLFFVHAKDDRFVNFPSFVQLRDRMHVPPEQCLVLESGGHKTRGHEREVVDAVLAFLKARL
jgi:pimeloyl-ACP methyl ester carboxylesterase